MFLFNYLQDTLIIKNNIKPKSRKNIKNLLTEFEKTKKYKLTFSKINNTFYTEFIDFCYEDKDHYTNTFNRNLGIADKTIMSISAHKDIKTFNMYHQVNNDAKIHAVKSVFENF